MNQALFSSATPEWATPITFFDTLNAEFGFVLDVCATPENAKCARHFTKEDDGLQQDWAGVAVEVGGRPNPAVWMNPPYGREIVRWMAKAREEARKGATVVCLVPARTDARWFQDSFAEAEEVVLVRGRLKFGGSKNSAPFPSAVFVFTPDPPPFPRVTTWDGRSPRQPQIFLP